MKKGIIITIGSDQYLVQTEEKEQVFCKARGKMKKDALLVGDLVEIDQMDETKKEAVITKVLPRKNFVKRPKMANITQLVCVVSLKLPSPDFVLLDKQLIFAEVLGIHPVICFNKIDLEEEETVRKIQSLYESLGYTVIRTNAKTKEGVAQLKKCLQGQVTAFAGNSGVGKSTLVNGIFEKELTKEGRISERNKRGKNTTTGATLYPIGENSFLADTPGFSTFELDEIQAKDLEQYFPEFEEYRKNCKYQGCSHIKETECGVKEALEQDKISKERYERYQKIYEEQKQKEGRRW